MQETGFKAPAVCILGDVVKLRESLNWFETRPLFGKRIVVTRTRKQAGALSGRLRSLGADVIEIPTIRIEPPKDLKEFGLNGDNPDLIRVELKDKNGKTEVAILAKKQDAAPPPAPPGTPLPPSAV